MPDNDTPFHHGSHRSLLRSPAHILPGRGVDAIVVPTARRPAYLVEAVALAAALGCTLVTLHSGKWTTAAKAAQRIPSDVDLIALDVPEPARLRLPSWDTSRLLAETVFARRTDLSAKRNLALMLGRMLGWSQVLFLDDDITELKADDVRAASGLLDRYPAVGLQIGGFPDNSVVCHAYRDAGGSQHTFVGGGALAVDVQGDISFFPDIYNDDWFFLLDRDMKLQPTAMTGHAIQYPYDPFRPERARGEELGDVLAEGIYWLLDQGRSILEANGDYWAWFLEQRRRFIADVIKMVESDAALSLSGKNSRMVALKSSMGRLALIKPSLCKKYVRAWARDRDSWLRHLSALPAGLSALPVSQAREAALAALSRTEVGQLTWQLGGTGPTGRAGRASGTGGISAEPVSRAPEAAPSPVLMAGTARPSAAEGCQMVTVKA